MLMVMAATFSHGAKDIRWHNSDIGGDLDYSVLPLETTEIATFDRLTAAENGDSQPSRVRPEAALAKRLISHGASQQVSVS